MGKDVLKHNGSAVDAAIATIMCLGIVNMESTGIGGGGHMTIYTRSTGKAEVIDFKECAPSGVKDSDFKKPWKKGQYFVDPKLIRGGAAIGVPGLLKGLELAHKRHGKMSWKTLFETSAKLAESKNHLGRYFLKLLDKDLAKHKKTEFKDFREFRGSWPEGNIMKNHALGKTLRIVANAGDASPFYDGVLSQAIIDDIQNNNGTMTVEDLKNYHAILREPVELQLGDNKLFSTPPPAGGTILSQILNILNGYHFSKRDKSDKLFKVYHKMIESFKWSYANTGLLGDPDFPAMTHLRDFIGANKSSMHLLNQNIKDLLSTKHGTFIRHLIAEGRTHDINYYNPDALVGKLKGTTHLSILAENGDAVALTSSLNDFFGSYVFSKKLGIIFNNQMKDFREFGLIAQSGNSRTTTNIILPGKRIPSLMSPTIVVDKDKSVVMVIGAAGGGRIPSIVAQIIARYLWLGMDLESAINEPRFHHQLYPNIVFVEKAVATAMRKKLQRLGHTISENIGLVAHYPLTNLARVNALVVERKKQPKAINGVNDRRGGGGIRGY